MAKPPAVTLRGANSKGEQMSDDLRRIRPTITNPELRVVWWGSNHLRLRPDGHIDQTIETHHSDGRVERHEAVIDAAGCNSKGEGMSRKKQTNRRIPPHKLFVR